MWQDDERDVEHREREKERDEYTYKNTYISTMATRTQIKPRILSD